MFTCTKRYAEICVAHRNWRAKTHCALIHGYARTVEITLACDQLDEHDWVMDLGNLRVVQNFLQEQWDHRLLVSDDDPLLEEFKKLEKLGALHLNVLDHAKGWGPSLEQSCIFIYDHIQPEIDKVTSGRCWISKIEIWEKTANRAARLFERPNLIK